MAQASRRPLSWTLQRWLRSLPARWPRRGQTRLIYLLERLLQRPPETLGRLGGLVFPFENGAAGRAYFFDLYEPETVALLRALLRPGDVFLDVGANVGYF